MGNSFFKKYSVKQSCDLFIAKMQKYTPEKIPPVFTDTIIKKMDVVYFKKGSLFCRQGDANTRLGMMLDGAAKAYSLDDKSKEGIIKIFCAQDMLSAEHAQDGGLSDRFIQFVRDSAVVVIDELPQLSNMFIKENIFPELLNINMEFYKEEMDNIRRLSQIRNMPDAKERIASFYKAYPGMDNHFSGSDVAGLIGLSRETYSRYKHEVLKKMPID